MRTESLLLFPGWDASSTDGRVLTLLQVIFCPNYMVPKKALYFCDEMPLNANGKIDRPKLVSMLKSEERWEAAIRYRTRRFFIFEWVRKNWADGNGNRALHYWSLLGTRICWEADLFKDSIRFLSN